MVKKCRNLLYRLVPVVSVFCILIGCVFALPASANSAGWNPTDPTSKLRPVVGARGYFVIDIYPGDDVAVSSRLCDYTILGAAERGVTSTFYDGHREVAVTIHSRSEHTIVDGKDIFRQVEQFYFADSSGSEVVLENLAPSYIYFDSFGGRWDASYINRLIWLDTRCHFEFSCDFWFLADNGTLIRVPFSSSGDAGGLQSPLFTRLLVELANKNNVAEGDPYLCTNAKLEISISSVYLETITSFTINREATLMGTLQSSPTEYPDEAMLQNDVAEFLINVGLNQPPAVNNPSPTPDYDVDSTGESLGGFLAGVVGSFFNTEVFGSFNFGDVFLVIIGVGIIALLLKWFGG